VSSPLTSMSDCDMTFGLYYRLCSCWYASVTSQLIFFIVEGDNAQLLHGNKTSRMDLNRSAECTDKQGLKAESLM
jgi:hypothetical protein